MTRVVRVVLDTNIVHSALVFGRGRAAQVREAWREGRCEPLVSKATVGELIRVLSYPKFKLDPQEQHELLGDYLPWCRTVTIPARRDPFALSLSKGTAVIGSASREPLSRAPRGAASGHHPPRSLAWPSPM